MNYLTIERASKTYGEKILFQNINLNINKGDKIALVAKNGTGKTTLLRVIANEEAVEGENAKILLHKSVNIGFLEQDPQMDNESLVLDYLLDSDDARVQCVLHYNEVMDSDNEEVIQAVFGGNGQVKGLEYRIKIERSCWQTGSSKFQA